MDQFEVLLDHGMNMKTMIELCFKDSQIIIQLLEQGKNMIEILCLNEKDVYFKNILFFSKYLSLKEAIQCAKDIEKSSKGLFSEWFQKSLYSICIIVFSFLMILFFDETIVPAMSVYAMDDHSIYALKIIKIVFILLFGLVFVIFILFVILSFQSTLRNSVYKSIFSKKGKSYYTLQFSYLFNILSQHGLSSYDCIYSISCIPFTNFSKIISKELLEWINHGDSLIQAFQKSSYIDREFIQFFILGFNSSKTDTFIKLYQQRTIQRHQVILKNTVAAIQVFSYGTVGILVLLVYQIMLSPLNMLSSF